MLTIWVDGTTAVEALEKGLNDLMDLCDVVSDKFTVARDAFVAEQGNQMTAWVEKKEKSEERKGKIGGDCSEIILYALYGVVAFWVVHSTDFDIKFLEWTLLYSTCRHWDILVLIKCDTEVQAIRRVYIISFKVSYGIHTGGQIVRTAFCLIYLYTMPQEQPLHNMLELDLILEIFKQRTKTLIL